MKLKTAKIVRSIAKIALLLCFLSLLGLGIFFTYKSVKFQPYKVRVSNVTDSAFTVSWVTDEPMVGVVYYGEKDSFLPGPLAWIGKQKAVDDRDVSNAQTECVSEFNKKASKTKDANFTVDIEGYDCNNVKVSKRGKYYTHHVTVQNLDAEKEYYFRVGDGYISYAKNSGTYTEGEVEGIDIFATKTKPVFTDITSPNPAYGTTEMVYQTSDGYFTFNKNYDSIVFLKVKNEDNEYGVFSSVANNDGGWSIDLSNVRDGEGLPVNLDDSILVFMPQAENHKAFVFEEHEYWNIEYPLRLPGNSEEDVKKEKVASKGVGLVRESLANWDHPGCKADITGHLDYCGLRGCWQKYIRGQELCGWKNISSSPCTGKVPATCNDEPEPKKEEPAVNTCPNSGTFTIGDFDTVCKQPSCHCTNREAKSTSVTCGNKCERKTDCINGQGSLSDLFTVCKHTTCRCTHRDSDGKDVPCGEPCKRKTAVSPPPAEEATAAVVTPCYYKIKGSGSCFEETSMMICTQKKSEGNYYTNPGCNYTYHKWVKENNTCVVDTSGKAHPNDPTCGGRTEASNVCAVYEWGRCNEFKNDKDMCFKKEGKDGYYPSMIACIKDHPTKVHCTLFCKTGSRCVAGAIRFSCESLAKQAKDSNGDCTYIEDPENPDNYCTPSEDFIELSEEDPNARLKTSPFKTYAQNSNNNEGNYVYHVPESGTYLFNLLRGQEKKIVADGKISYYFYYNRNGIEGYQEPEDLSSVKADEDLLVEAEVAVISISKIAETKEIKLSQGINIVSFDFMPNSIDDPYTSTDFLIRANEKGNKVSHISYFSAGKWDGGTSYNFETKEMKGMPFNLGFGKGYVVVAEEDTTVTIPGYNVQSPVPIALSSGWNLVGVHGYDTQYTANSLINSINTIQGLKSNNVTYWPTSKGMYQGYQLSEGQSYGQDFSISKDLGYFVRISEFNAPDSTCKSIIWNPGGGLNGKCGSGN